MTEEHPFGAGEDVVEKSSPYGDPLDGYTPHRQWVRLANGKSVPRDWIRDPQEGRRMTTTMTAPAIDASLIERVLIHGDLRQLSAAQKVSYYKAVCESVGLNPLTQPFAYLVLNGKEILYAKREATEQLRQIHAVSIQIMAREVMEDCYIVTARATLPNGRQDENIGAVPIAGLKGESRANAMMKAETKSKRRVTLAICGLGMLDETEVESIQAEAPTSPVMAAINSVPPPKAGTLLQPGISENVIVVAPEPDFELPPGFALIDDIKEDGPWLQVWWGRDAKNGWTKRSTKVPKIANEARAAFEERVPVKLHSKDGKYLDKVERLDGGMSKAELAGTQWTPEQLENQSL